MWRAIAMGWFGLGVGFGSAAGCGAGSDGAAADAGAANGADGGGTGCERALAADGPRRVLVSMPYDAEGNKADGYRVLELDAAGELDDPDVTFTMGRAVYGAIAFTPDGELAIVAQEAGTLGVVAFDGGGGAPRVVHAALDAGMYAGALAIGPRGDTLYVLDSQWREHGGGVYALPIGCDGTLGVATLLLPAKLPEAMFGLAGDQLLVVAHDVLDSPLDRDAHRIAMGDAPAVLASVDGFPDDEASVSSAALTHDGRYLLIADNSELSGIPNRIAVVELGARGLTARSIVTPIEDPFRVLTSPLGDAALVVSGYGDALFALDYAPDAATPFTVRGELDYVGPGPILPSDAVMLERGALTGLVLVVEVGGVRRVRFGDAGAVTDLGTTALAIDGVEGLIGAIGVAP